MKTTKKTVKKPAKKTAKKAIQKGTTKRSGRWTNEEVELLQRVHAKGMDIVSIAKLLGRTMAGVYTKLESLDRARRDQLRSDLEGRIPKKGAVWTPEETQRLVRAFKAGESIEALVRQHQRSTNGVVGKLRALNLIVEFGDTYYRVGEPVLKWRETTDLDARVYLGYGPNIELLKSQGIAIPKGAFAYYLADDHTLSFRTRGESRVPGDSVNITEQQRSALPIDDPEVTFVFLEVDRNHGYQGQ